MDSVFQDLRPSPPAPPSSLKPSEEPTMPTDPDPEPAADGARRRPPGPDPSPTRERLRAALTEQLRDVPLSKITVSGLAEAAGITRQAFYYHFADVYDLAVWVFRTDVANGILAHASYDQWADGFLELMGYVQDHATEADAVVRSLSHQELESFFFHALRPMMSAIVAELESGLPAGLSVAGEDRAFIIDHYTLSVLGHFLHWLARGMRNDPVALVERLERLMRGSVQASLERFAQPRPGAEN